MQPKLILINPWIYDFAAYDLWSKPLGLLYIAGYLKKCGFDVLFLDCLDIHHPGMSNISSMTQPVRRSFGTGKFWRKKISKPSSLSHIKRTYSRYGITRQLFISDLKSVQVPAAILVTSLMTYWYPGVREAITLAKESCPEVPVILGGIYARLCRQHALQYSGTDSVVSEGGLHSLDAILDIFRQCEIPVPRDRPNGIELSYPAFDMLNRIDYICISTSSGCPYRCQYCASSFLNPGFSRREPAHILEEIQYWHNHFGVQDFAFYDDALLVQSERYMGVVLEELARLDLNLRFHTPNALHVREISPDIARLLYRTGFRTIRPGLETSDIRQHDELDSKVSEGEFENAVRNLNKAGFNKKDIGTYILIGLPGQSVDSVGRTIDFVHASGATPYLAEYSPLPHTPLWEKALAHSSYDLVSEPLFHNNTLFPCWDKDKRQRVPELKRMVREIRQK